MSKVVPRHIHSVGSLPNVELKKNIRERRNKNLYEATKEAKVHKIAMVVAKNQSIEMRN